MRKALPAAALFLSSLLMSAGGEDAPAPPSVSLLPGTDTPEAAVCPDGAAYVYREYTIYVRQTADTPGRDIDVYKPSEKVADPCGAVKGARYYSVPAGAADAGFFAGVSGRYLFIDQGTGPSYRTISILDMREKTYPLRAVRYSDAKIEDGVFTYYETRDEIEGALAKIPCPEASEWKQQGLGVEYEEKISFDLETGKLTPLRVFRCSPAN
ncbi:MAG: hypothetical protein AB1598_06140 [Thermodesulfobacteriota bacterium]